MAQDQGVRTGVHAALATLRPQVYGKTSPDKIADPIIEPKWVGIRVLAAVDEAAATVVDEDGVVVGGFDPILEALTRSLQASSLVLDGFLTKQAEQRSIALRHWSDESPSMSAFVGLRRDRAKDTLALKENALAASLFDPEDPVSFVATDLLWLDDDALFDVPLVERRRLLESVLAESDLVRLGAFVRPPINTWIGTWRAQGFDGVTYKAANSRYLPGQPNRDWTISGMPRR